MEEKERITRAEMDVLRFVMDHEPVTVRQIADASAAKKRLAVTTVGTLLERLRGKGFLCREAAEGGNLYRLAVPKQELLRDLVDDFVESTLGGSLSPFVAYLTERGDLSADEARKLIELADRLEEGR